jgi:hypothetical protein
MKRLSDPRQLYEYMKDGHTEAENSKGKTRPDDICIEDFYQRKNYWNDPMGEGNALPLPVQGVRELNLVNLSRDDRWVNKITGSKILLGVYRTPNGGHWVLRFDRMFSEHQLIYLGTAQEAIEFFSKRNTRF